MNDHPLLPIPARTIRDALRDDLIDQLRSKSLREFIAARADSALDHANETDPYLKRRKWALSRLHTKKEIRASIAEFISSLGSLPRPVEPDALTGEDVSWHAASIWEAWGGINYVGSMGSGVASLSPDDIDWGDQIGDATFSSQENAQEFADAMDRLDIPHTDPIQGPDGTWKVFVAVGGSD